MTNYLDTGPNGPFFRSVHVPEPTSESHVLHVIYAEYSDGEVQTWSPQDEPHTPEVRQNIWRYSRDHAKREGKDLLNVLPATRRVTITVDDFEFPDDE